MCINLVLFDNNTFMDNIIGCNIYKKKNIEIVVSIL